MLKLRLPLLAIMFGVMLLNTSCSGNEDYTQPQMQDPTDDNPTDDDPMGFESLVNFNASEVPYQNLSEYNFFQGALASLNPQEDVIPYDLQSPLFSDYAKKDRFLWMPVDVSASYVSDTEILNFPNGTVLIKNFSYDNVLPSGDKKIIETRVMYKLNGNWEFAEYVWNDAQTEAVLDLDGSFQDITWLDDEGMSRTVNYRVPSGGECFTCHKKNDQPFPIGVRPQNVNKLYAYEDGMMNQLERFQNQGFLDNYPGSIDTVVRWDDESADLTERVRSYIDVNCAHCHAEDSHCDYRPMRFAYEETVIDDNLGICVEPDESIGSAFTHIINSGSASRSVLFERIQTIDEAIRMPLLGRSINHDEGIALIQEWINQLEPACE